MCAQFPSVLVIDDDADIQTVVKIALSRMGFSVDLARDGVVAVEKIRGRDYDAILLDLLMPRMNGFEVLREIKSMNPALLKRTIILTGASQKTLGSFDDSDVFRLLRKPFDLPALRSAVEACTGHLSEPAPALLPIAASPRRERRSQTSPLPPKPALRIRKS